MPLINIDDRLFYISKSALEQYELTPEEAVKRGHAVHADDEISPDELKTVVGGLKPTSLKSDGGRMKPMRLKTRMGKPLGPNVLGDEAWYSGD